MIFGSMTQFHVYLLWVNAPLALRLNRFLNVKALVGALSREKAQPFVDLRFQLYCTSSRTQFRQQRCVLGRVSDFTR